jgi:hypothetical protein
LHMYAVNVTVGVASPVPLVGHIHLNGTNFILRLGNLSSPSSVNLKNIYLFHCPFMYTCLYSVNISIYENIEYLALAFSW